MTIKWLGERIERIRIMTEDVCCGNCEHFMQHYVWWENGIYSGYTATNCGHCMYPRMKDRRAEQCCQHFSKKKE